MDAQNPSRVYLSACLGNIPQARTRGGGLDEAPGKSPLHRAENAPDFQDTRHPENPSMARDYRRLWLPADAGENWKENDPRRLRGYMSGESCPGMGRPGKSRIGGQRGRGSIQPRTRERIFVEERGFRHPGASKQLVGDTWQDPAHLLL